jgi:hypothetical protein
MRLPREAFDHLKSGIAEHLDDEPLAALAVEFDLSVMSSGAVPVDVSNEILELLNDGQFLSQPGSWRLARLIWDAWDFFPEEATPRLLTTLQTAFGRFSSYLGPFVTAEVLANHLDPLQAMAVFRELYVNTTPPARALVSHGLRELTLRSNDQQLRELIIGFLNEMLNDDDAGVRSEATLVLTRLKVPLT